MRNDFAMRALHLDADHFRDDVAASFHDNGIADLQPEPRDFVFVMEGRARDGNSADHFGREVRDRRKGACAAHLHGDVDDLGLDLPCRVFESNCPTRGFGGEPQSLLLSDAIDLQDNAVDFIRQSFALRFPFAAERQRLIDIRTQPPPYD